MHLVFISPFGFIPKATLSHRILPLATGLIKKGHKVIIAIPPYTNPRDSGQIENYSGVKLINISLSGKIFYSLRIGIRLAQVAKEFNPDKIYIFKPKGYSALAVMILWLKGKRYPLILDVDDLEADREMERRMGYNWWMRIFFRYQERWLLKRVEALTAASHYLTRHYKKMLGKEKVYYLPNGPLRAGGLEEGNFRRENEYLQKKLGLQEKRIVLLYTRFTEFLLKDIIDFVRLLSKKYPQGILLVVGEGYGNVRKILKTELEKIGLLRFVTFTGWLEREKLKGYLSLGEVAIYPMSDTPFNRAKCSAKLIELMDMEKPIVASPVGEILTYIKDGETGLLAKNIEEMVDKVIEILEDREKAKRIGEGARRFLWHNFTWDKLISTLDFLKEEHTI